MTLRKLSALAALQTSLNAVFLLLSVTLYFQEPVSFFATCPARLFLLREDFWYIKNLLAFPLINEEIDSICWPLLRPILVHCPLAERRTPAEEDGRKTDCKGFHTQTHVYGTHTHSSHSLMNEHQTQAGRGTNGQLLSQSGNQLSCCLPQDYVIQGVLL